MPIFHSCPKLFKFLRGPTQREWGIGKYLEYMYMYMYVHDFFLQLTTPL